MERSEESALSETTTDSATSSSASVGTSAVGTSAAGPNAIAVNEQLQSQVNSLDTDAQQISDKAIQKQVRQLIELIKRHLQTRTLNASTQRELARLLTLATGFNHRHTQQLEMLDLAVSILLESKESPADTKKPSKGGKTDAQNLVFVQETRRQIARQSQDYPNILRSILITGGGTPYLRLITGLSWFFLLFVITPLIGGGLIFAARDVAGFVESQERIEALEAQNTTLLEEREQQQKSISMLTRRRDSLAAQLGRTGSKIAVITPDAADASAVPVPESPQVTAPADSPAAGEAAAIVTTVPVELSVLKDIKAEIDAELSAREDEPTFVASSPRAAEPSAASSEATPEDLDAEATARRQRAQDSLATTERLTATERILTTRFYWMLWAVAMGALGSTISVIVRANTFIQQAQENDNDLFLTGFFRPFVGMSFAIFCVALVEAGIFSGIFDLKTREDTDRTYFYVAIAFVAGFSERLVRDVVIKTEDTLAGPSRRD